MYKDKDLYKRKNNNISKLEQIKNNKIKITSAFLSILLSFNGTICLASIKNEVDFQLKHTNPFNGSAISSDFIATYQTMKATEFICDGEFKDTIEQIKNSDIDEKKAYLLYYALLSNDYLTKEEKEKLTGYIQYFIDNKYLDYEYVYNKLALFKINPNDETLHDDGAAGIYIPDNNSITFANDSDRDYAMSHETFHSEDKFLILNLNKKSFWFIEGLTDLLSYEYNDTTIAYDAEVTFCRILCEFVGSDVLFETRAKGDMNILINSLVNKGIKREKVDELFELFNEYRWERKKENPDFDSLRIKIIDLLRYCYLDISKNDKFVNPMFYQHILYISNLQNCDSGIKYYFNSQKIKEMGIPNVISEAISPANEPYTINISKGKVEYYSNCELVIIEETIDGITKKIVKKRGLSKEEFNISIDGIISEIKENKSQKSILNLN